MARKRHPPIVRAVADELRNAGFKPTIAIGRHVKIRFVDRTGKSRLIVVARSTANRNADANAMSFVRRTLRQMEASP